MGEPITAAAAQAAPTPFTSAASLSFFQQRQQVILGEHPKYDGLAVGACVFKPGSDDGGENRILLVQRAASDSMPLHWEVPGGACDDEDESLLHAAARELLEESGLRARAIRALISPPIDGASASRYQGLDDGSKKELGGSGGLGDVFFSRRKKCSKFTYDLRRGRLST